MIFVHRYIYLIKFGPGLIMLYISIALEVGAIFEGFLNTQEYVDRLHTNSAFYMRFKHHGLWYLLDPEINPLWNLRDDWRYFLTYKLH